MPIQAKLDFFRHSPTAVFGLKTSRRLSAHPGTPWDPPWGPERPLWGPQRPLWRPQRRLWRPKNEDSSIKMKRFGSNLFNLMELSSFFGRNRVPGGFQGVLGAAGTISGQIPARKNIKSGLNRLLSQPYGPLLIQSGAVVPPGLWGPLGPQKRQKIK